MPRSMFNITFALIVLALNVAQSGAKLIKRGLDLPDWSADEAYISKLARWQTPDS